MTLCDVRVGGAEPTGAHGLGLVSLLHPTGHCLPLLLDPLCRGPPPDTPADPFRCICGGPLWQTPVTPGWGFLHLLWQSWKSCRNEGEDAGGKQPASAQTHPEGRLVPCTPAVPACILSLGPGQPPATVCRVLDHVSTTRRGDVSGLSVRKHSTSENNWFVVSEQI